MTVVPGNEENSQNLLLAAVVGVIGLLVVAAVALLAWRRRTAPAVSPKP
jgi:nitrate reductase gamma subunit